MVTEITSLTDEQLLTFVLLSLLKPDAISEKGKDGKKQNFFFEVCFCGNEILNLFSLNLM